MVVQIQSPGGFIASILPILAVSRKIPGVGYAAAGTSFVSRKYFVGCGRLREHPSRPGQDHGDSLAKAGGRFGPAKHLLNALAHPRADRIAGMVRVRPSMADCRLVVFPQSQPALAGRQNHDPRPPAVCWRNGPRAHLGTFTEPTR